MRITRLYARPAASTLLAASMSALIAALAPAQEPPAPSPAAAEESPPAAEPPAPGNERPEGQGRRRGQRRQPIVIEAAVVHPVAGPAIENGVVVIRGERIVAVGKKGEVEVPENATVRSFPTGHVYPGLIDAHTDAFTDGSLRNDGGADGGVQFADDLRRQADRGDELVQAGITTAYVTVRSPALVRGQGAIVRPRADGFEPWKGREHAALQLRMTNGPGPSNPLQRQQQLQAVDGLFEGLEEFRKARTDHEDALKKYEKEFADYLAFHQKKKDGGEAKSEAKPGEATPEGNRQGPPAGPGAGREGRRGNRGGPPPTPTPPPNPTPDPKPTPDPPKDGPSDADVEAALATLLQVIVQDPPKQDPPKQEPPKPPAAGQEGAAAPAAPKPEEPKRPTYPKAPPADPQREALLRVLDGELPLRVEAHRADEVRAALRLQRTRNIPSLIVEQAYGSASLAQELAEQGVAVVLTETLVSFEPPYDGFDTKALPAKLAAHGVSFALATGRARNASLLPIIAAAAVGAGLDREQALRAITLTPAEILGVAQDTGSLQPGRFADVLVCDRPLFASDSRMLLVLSKGRTEHEVK